MEGQLSSGKYTLPNFAQDLDVMLVDHDSISLNKIKAKLEKFSYQVTGVKSASEALSMIWKNKTCYKFVIANYRTLPKMDYGSFVHELWQKEIPLIWMSRSYDEAEQALHDGASFLVIEPISSKKLKPLWQFAFRRRSNQEAGGAFGSAANKQEVKKEQVNQRDKEKELITKTNNQQEGSKHKRLIDDQQGNMQDKRTKYTLNVDQSESILELQELDQNEKGKELPLWKSELHNKFVAAYRKLGDRATGKTIFEEMKGEGLDIKQVRSHLQKYKKSLEKKNVDSGATSLPVTNNSYSSLARHPGNMNLPNFTPCANQDLDTNFAASSSTRHQSQLPEGGVAATNELLGVAQARVTSGIATNPDNFPSNVGDGIQNPKPMMERPAAGLPNFPPNANQNQELTTNFAATFNSKCKNKLAAGVATTTEQANIITPGIATNSENVQTNFTHGTQNLQPIVELASAALSSRHPAYGNQNQDLNTIRAAPFSTRHQSQLPEGGVAGTTELVGSVQGERTSGIATNSESFSMNISDGIQNQEPILEQALAELPDLLIGDENVNVDGIFDSENPGDIGQNQESMMEHTLSVDSSNQTQRPSELADRAPTYEGETGFGWCS